jgi:photosystem II stability/assembly factor-like uncharacterized protein
MATEGAVMNARPFDRFRIQVSTLAALVLLAALPGSLKAGVGEWTSGGPDGAIVESLAVHPSNPSTVYASTLGGLCKSVDAGATWTPTGQFGGLIVLPTSSPSVVYATSSSLISIRAFYRSTDGGETWVERDPPPTPSNVASLASDANDVMTVYAATDNGIFRTTDGGDTWENVPNPLTPGIGVAGIAVDPTDSRVLYAAIGGSSAISGVYRSGDRGATWSRTSFRDSVSSLLLASYDEPCGPFDYGCHPCSSSEHGCTPAVRLFALTTNGLYVTTDRGATWRRLATGLQNVSHLAIDSTDSNRLYVTSVNEAFSSSDGGETVTPISGVNFGAVLLKGIVASRSSVVLVGSDRGISRSEDAGRTWGAANRGIREVFVPSVAIDPTDPAVVFAAGPRGIYESSDGGESWNEPVPGSPDAEVVAIDPVNHSTMYAGAERGVYKSTDGGREWRNSLLLADSIAALLIDPKNPSKLFAAHGSVWRSLDGGDHWTSVLTPEDNYSSYYYPNLPALSSVALAPSDSATLYVGGGDDGVGISYRSDDGGDHWSSLTNFSGMGVGALMVDACDAQIAEATGFGGVYRTPDAGGTWTPEPTICPSASAVLSYALVRDPRHSSSIFAGTSCGLYWSNDRGVTWTRFEPRLDEAVRSLALDSTGRFLYAGTERGVFRLERTFEACRNGPDRLCLLGSRYQVSVTARHPRTGASITGRAIVEGDRFGYFSFPDVTGDPEFPEVVVKMADATGAPPPYGGSAWVFHSSLTDLVYTLTVVETQTGRIRTYEASNATCGKADTSAFERDCAAQASPTSSLPPPSEAGYASGAELALLGGRFRATVRARDPRTGRTVDGTALPRGDGFGYFSLPGFTGDPTFPEVFVKMTDATALPGGYFWLFRTGLTDLEYTLTVSDSRTGAVRTYTGGAIEGTRLCGFADTTAFHD